MIHRTFQRSRIARAVTHLAVALTAVSLAPVVWSSSHREAPFIAMNPSVDATDLYICLLYTSPSPRD